MARPVKPEQHAALLAIRNLVAEHGEELGLKLARVQFAHIHKSTWHRWASQVKAEDAVFAAAEPMPVARVRVPPPLQDSEVVAAPGGVIDFFGQVGAMMAACDALQDYAWPRDPATGSRRVRNPVMLERATRLRAVVLDLAHRRDEAAWNISRVRAFHAELGNAIGEVLQDAGNQDLTGRVVGTIRRLVAAHEDHGRFLGVPVTGEAE